MNKILWILSCCAAMMLLSSCEDAEKGSMYDVAIVCSEGATRCDGNTVMRCQADHSWGIQTKCVSLGQVCKVDAAGAACVDEGSVAPDDGRQPCGKTVCESGEVCIDEQCVQNSCTGGLMLCSTETGNTCIDIKGTDENNCGGCGYRCVDHAQNHATSNTCTNGQCEYICTNGYINIGTATSPNCIDPKTDAQNCGEKGNRCENGEVCVDGACVQNSCTDGLMLCSTETGNTCIDIKGTDENNCGGCGYRCADHAQVNATSNTCTNGQCEYICTNGYINIGTATSPNCIDPKTDRNHCGEKDNICGSGKVCVDGACVQNSCTDGLMLCSTETGNTCIDIKGTDENNCGGCGYRSVDHAQVNATSNTCTNGQCEYICTEGYINIGTATSPNCIDPKTDRNHCGEKDNICGSGKVCVDGACVQNSCTDGLMLCSTETGNTCIDIKGTDENNCGGCGYRCVDHAQVNATSNTCTNGQCEYICTEGYINIGTATSPNCIDPKTDAQNCGEKGNRCENGEVCVDGACVQNSCADGLMLCSTETGNTCIDIKGTDENNCGGCGYRCVDHAQVNATSDACLDGRCQYTCTAPYMNAGSADVPECVDTTKNPRHCGTVGNDCLANENVSFAFCHQGECVIYSCKDGYHLEDGKCLANDDAHCGKKGETDCTSQNKVCYKETASSDGICVNCINDSSCTGVENVCDPSSHQCVACVDDDDCGAHQICSVDDILKGTQCISVKCKNDSECKSNDGRPNCDPSSHQCVACVDDDCMGETFCDVDHTCTKVGDLGFGDLF